MELVDSWAIRKERTQGSQWNAWSCSPALERGSRLQTGLVSPGSMIALRERFRASAR
jgi:hypothetical protein